MHDLTHYVVSWLFSVFWTKIDFYWDVAYPLYSPKPFNCCLHVLSLWISFQYLVICDRITGYKSHSSKVRSTALHVFEKSLFLVIFPDDTHWTPPPPLLPPERRTQFICGRVSSTVVQIKTQHPSWCFTVNCAIALLYIEQPAACQFVHFMMP